MRTWIKFLIIGWSIVSVGIIIVSFQLTKNVFIQEDYQILIEHKGPPANAWKPPETDIVVSNNPGIFDQFIFETESITKQDFVNMMKKAKSVTIESKNKIKDNSIYLLLPIYAFTIWGLPILVFSGVGIIFGRGKGNQMIREPEK
jgi:hypothetical protein